MKKLLEAYQNKKSEKTQGICNNLPTQSGLKMRFGLGLFLLVDFGPGNLCPDLVFEGAQKTFRKRPRKGGVPIQPLEANPSDRVGTGVGSIQGTP